MKFLPVSSYSKWMVEALEKKKVLALIYHKHQMYYKLQLVYKILLLLLEEF